MGRWRMRRSVISDIASSTRQSGVTKMTGLLMISLIGVSREDFPLRITLRA